jgi:hypothetical protein
MQIKNQNLKPQEKAAHGHGTQCGAWLTVVQSEMLRDRPMQTQFVIVINALTIP